MGTQTTIDSEKKKKSKVSAHGQGGVGKTTMAAAVVRDMAVRSAFERIGWVSVGQTPAVMELQRVLPLARRWFRELQLQPVALQVLLLVSPRVLL